MSISQAEIIAQKTATKLANKKLKVALIISAVYVLLYHFVLLRWEAATMELYYSGVLANTLALSVITGYIFYYITVLTPYKSKIAEIQSAVIASKSNLADLINRLIVLLTQNEDWRQTDNISLKAFVDSHSPGRRIWLEQCSGIFKTSQVLMTYNPYTLYIISDTLNEIQRQIEDILHHSDLFEDEYLKLIIWLINTDTYKKLFGLGLNSLEQFNIGENKPEYVQGTTLLDSFFCEELSLRLFVENGEKIFIDEVRKLLDK